MHDGQNELASCQPSNEPTMAEKEAAFKFWLESYWNEGPFTDTSPETINYFPGGYGFLDLPGLSKVNTEKIAALYGYGTGFGYFGVRNIQQCGQEMMMLDFILLDLADELGYSLVEFQSDEHYRLYLEHKDNLDAGGWIPYDGKGMPEGLEEKLVYIFRFGSNKTEFTRKSYALTGKCWSWHPIKEGEAQFNGICIAFYKVKETESVENDNV